MTDSLSITGKQLLDELDLPAYLHIDFISQTRTLYSGAMNQLVNYFTITSSGKANGYRDFAIRFLFSRCINDLLVGFHLVTHGYIIQFYSVSRSILESLDKISLFQLDEKYVDSWIKNDLADQHLLSPGNIRKLLGKKSYDEMYSHFCEQGSHPSFESRRSVSYMKVDKDGHKTIVVKIGPTDIVYPIISALGLCHLLLLSVTQSLITNLKSKDSKITHDFMIYEIQNMENVLKDVLKPALTKYFNKEPTPMTNMIEELDTLMKNIMLV